MQQDARLLNHLVGAGEQRGQHFEADRPRSAEVDDQLELGRSLNRQVTRLFALQYAGGVEAEQTISNVNSCPIAQDPAGGEELTSGVHRENRMASRQHDKLWGMVE